MIVITVREIAERTHILHVTIEIYLTFLGLVKKLDISVSHEFNLT